MILFISLWCHIFGRSDVIKYLGFIRYLIHLAIPEVYDCHCFAGIWIFFEENIIWLKIPMDNIFPLHVNISLKDLPKDVHNFIIGQSIRMFLYIIRKSSTLEMLHHKVNMMILEYNIMQFYYIFMPWILQLPQITQSCDLATQEISGDFIINSSQIDWFDCYLFGIMAPRET